jgi:AGZA family xanthine/uracil permease-like MFS transporter
MSHRHRLERYFEFKALDTNWRTEILAGFTTFVTMAYIIFVNPAVLHETGMGLAAVTAATCVSAAPAACSWEPLPAIRSRSRREWG